MLIRYLSYLILILVLSACGGGGGGDGQSNDSPAGTDEDLIGIAGGTVLFEGLPGTNEQITVTVPPGAVESDTRFVVELTDAPQPFDLQSYNVWLDLAPHGQTFDKPVTLTLPYDPSAVGDESRLKLFYLDSTQDTWQQIPVQSVNPLDNTLTAELDHFSDYALVETDNILQVDLYRMENDSTLAAHVRLNRPLEDVASQRAGCETLQDILSVPGPIAFRYATGLLQRAAGADAFETVASHLLEVVASRNAGCSGVDCEWDVAARSNGAALPLTSANDLTPVELESFLRGLPFLEKFGESGVPGAEFAVSIDFRAGPEGGNPLSAADDRCSSFRYRRVNGLRQVDILSAGSIDYNFNGLVDSYNDETPVEADEESPTVPTGLQALPLGGTAMGVSWSGATDNVGVTGYRVVMDGAFYVDTGTTEENIANLEPLTEYCFTVAAFDAAGNLSASTATVCAETTSDVDEEPPTMPTELSIDRPAWNSIRIEWAPAEDNVGVGGYALLRDGEALATTEDSFFLDTLPAPLTEYCYQVSAFDAAENSSGLAGPICQTTGRRPTPPPPDTSAPSTPGNLQVEAVSETAISLNWNPSSDNRSVTLYKIYRDGSFLDTAPTLTFQDSRLAADTEYCYAVSALDAAQNESDQSGAVCATTFAPDTTNPDQPGAPDLTAVSQTEIDLAWDPVSDNVGVTGYKVYRDSVYLASTDNTALSDTELSPGTSYCYQVAAFDEAGNLSDLSDEACIATQEPPNEPPVASLSSPATVQVGSPANFDGSASSDPNGDLLGYQWELVTAPFRSFVSVSPVGDGSSAVITPDIAGTYEVELTVDDGEYLSDPASTSVLAITGTLQPDTEPNGVANSNDFSNAQTITVPATIAGAVNSGSDVDDSFSFVAPTSGTYQVTISEFGNRDLDLYLFAVDPAAEYQSLADAPYDAPIEVITVSLSAGSVYVVSVNAYDTGGANTAYLLSIAPQ